MYYLDILSYLAEKTSPGMLFDKNFTVFSLFKLYLELYYSKTLLQTLKMLFCLTLYMVSNFRKRTYTVSFIERNSRPQHKYLYYMIFMFQLM